MKQILNVSYGPRECQMLDWYLPDAEAFDVVVWFHGGGMEAGSRKDGEALAAEIVANGLGFVSVEYSMYPQARYPEFVLDAAQAVAYVQKEAQKHGGSGRIIVSGQSAGAYLTMMLCMNEAYLQNAGASQQSIIAFVSDSAQMTAHFNVLRERGMDSRLERIDEAAPLFYAGIKHIEKPLLMICYEQDIECRVQQNQLMFHSLLRFQKDAPVQLCVLPGRHCEGSSKKDENGKFPYITELVKFIKAL